MTTKTEVLAWLKDNQDARGIEHWKKHKAESGGLSSYGIGLTRLRKYAKAIGRDAKLAKSLWGSKVYEAKIVSLLVDDPKAITVEQAEAQVKQLHGGYLAHVFSSCDATLAKAPFVVELAEEWIAAKDEVRRRCGYGLLYEISKQKKHFDEPRFLGHIQTIDKTWKKQSVDVLMSMGLALLGMGGRSKKLHGAALKVAKKIGPVEFDPDGRCDPTDFAARLESPAITKRLGI